MRSELATRCELALMGKVVPVKDNSEVQDITNYVLSAVGVESEDFNNVVENHINRYSKNNVKYVVCNTVEGMRCITFLLENATEDEEYAYPAPFEEDYGSKYPCAFCYVLNLDVEYFSELGDCFFEMREDGYYHRV